MCEDQTGMARRCREQLMRDEGEEMEEGGK
jgi:hypothetical protein